MRIPRKLPIGSPFASEWNAMVDALHSQRITSGGGLRMKVTPFGTMPSIDPSKPAPSAPGEATVTVYRFRVKSVQGDYMTCRTWDGTTEGGSDIYVAKPPKLRHSVTSESIEGTTVSYTYGSRSNNEDGYRTATAGGVDITEIVMPVYIDNDEIFAVKPDNGTDVTVSSVELVYLDLNVDGRCWGQVA